MNVVGSLRRSHDRAGITLLSPKLLGLAPKGAQRRYVEEHGPDSLKPERKNPYSKRDIEALHALPYGFNVCGRTLDWDAAFFVAWDAALALTRFAGPRKAEATLAASAHAKVKSAKTLRGASPASSFTSESRHTRAKRPSSSL